MEKLTTANARDIAEKVNAILENKSEIITADDETLALAAEDSGKTVVLDRAAGVAVTLPIADPGLRFKFFVKTSAATGSYVITAGKTSDLYIGSVTMVDTDTSDTHTDQVPDVSDDDALTLNGSTTGGLIGSWLELECYTLNRWFVRGVSRHTGNVATPFS
jgi:hypothetical protein